MNDRHFHFVMISVLVMHDSLRNVDGDISNFRSVQQLNAYFETFFARNQSISADQWFGALPTPMERLQMKKLIKEVFSAKDYQTQCSPSVLNKYDAVRSYLNVTLFKKDFCVIHEIVPVKSGAVFKRFWGYVVISDSYERPVHHSAAHFESDGDVCDEAAAVFERTAGTSLVIAGANRFAVIGQESNQCQLNTAMADAAHNNETMFHTMNEAVYEAALNDPRQGNTFIQWHGMAETSCSRTQAFVSAGATNQSHIYDNTNLPANQIVEHFNKLMGGASTPASSSLCHLSATTNIFGRYLNGVPAGNVCYQNANTTDIQGVFVHIEQKGVVRDNWDLWTKVINASFPVSSGGASCTDLSFLIIVGIAAVINQHCLHY